MTMRTLLLFLIAAALFVPLAAYAQLFPDVELGFTPLTNLPGIESVADQSSLPDFFNSLYRMCIGAAVVIAILQIMRAGAYFMFNKESVAHNEKGKTLISSSVLGLLLVLSPAIVFTIINPDILDLKLDVSGLKPPDITSGDGEFTGRDIMLWSREGDRAQHAERCKKEGGTISYGCNKKDGSGGRVNVPAGQACKDDEVNMNYCRSTTDSPTTQNECSVKYTAITAGNQGQTCNPANGFVNIPNGCCIGSAPNGVCCGKPKDAAGTPATPAPSTPAPAKPAPAKPAPAPTPAVSKYYWRVYFVPCTGNNCDESKRQRKEAGTTFATASACQANFDPYVEKQAKVGWYPDEAACSCTSPTHTQPSCNIR
jgi:hypothetical protein